jgi:5-enolpyruvylshikimate-3-phosphate synthase
MLPAMVKPQSLVTVASLRKLKQAADTEYEDHRVEMACTCLAAVVGLVA